MANKFALSQSGLKKWKETPPNVWYKQWVTKEMPRSNSNATFFGSYMHALMLKPEEVDTKFIISDVEKPSANVASILTAYYTALLENNVRAAEETKEPKPSPLALTLDHTDLLKSIAIAKDYYATTPDRAVKELLKSASYFEFLKTTGGRTIMGVDEQADGKILKDILLTDPMSKGFFEPKKNCECLFETSIYNDFELDGFDNIDFIPTKGFIDMIHINLKRKEIREVDLKITDDAYNFYRAVRQFDYPMQHSFYDYLLREWLKVYKDGEYKDFMVMNPLNVVIDNDIKVPYIYEYNYADLHIKRYGFENSKFKGWEDDLYEIAWHLDQNDWSRPKSHIQNKKLLIDVFTRK